MVQHGAVQEEGNGTSEARATVLKEEWKEHNPRGVLFRTHRKSLLKFGVLLVVLVSTGLVYEFSRTLCFNSKVHLDYSFLKEIPRVERISSGDFYTQYKDKGIPVVISGNLEHFPATGKWTPDWFKQEYGRAEVNVHRGNLINIDSRQAELMTLTMSDFVDWIHLHETVMEEENFNFNFSGYQNLLEDFKDWDINWEENTKDPSSVDFLRIPYLAEGGAFFEENSELMDDLLHLPLMQKYSKAVEAFLWMGPKGARTGIHADLDPFSILHQIYGVKKILLWSPDKNEKYLYLSDKYDPGAITSRVDPWNVNTTEFPLFADSQPMEVILRPGEMLYIPMGWIHSVTALSSSISVSGKAERTCEKVAYWPRIILHWLHGMGLYKKGHCTCHDAYGDPLYY